MTEEAQAVLLQFAESVAYHNSSNLHAWHPDIITAARRAIKAAGGELREYGRYKSGETEPMGHQEYDRVKDERRVTRVHEALKRGPIRFVCDDIYDSDNKRICSHGQLHWIRTWLEKLGVKLIQHGRTPNASWTLSTKEDNDPKTVN